MSFPYKNPISPNQLLGQQSLERTKTYGTSYSTLSTGGYMEVYSLDQLYYTIPSSTYGPIEYSGNSIPITFSKGSGTTFSFDTLTLQPDNISSGRRKLGMLVYVKEVDQVYQYNIDNYLNLFTAATASTGTVVVSDFGTTIKGNSAAGLSFISGWTANTIDGVSGVTRTNAVWKKYYGNNLSITGGTFNSGTGTLTLTNITGGTQNISGFGSGGGGGDSITGGTFDKNLGELTLNSTGSSITITGFTDVYTTGGTYNSGLEKLELYDNSGNTITITGFSSNFTCNTSATCINDLYVDNLYGCSPINVNDLLIGNSGFTSENITGLTIINNYIQTTGNTIVIDLVNSKLNDSSGNQSINLTARRQYDTNSVVTADWETKSLNDSTGVGSVSWEMRGLYDTLGLTSQLWNDRRLYDSNEIKSLDYNSRGLENSSSVEVLNWENGTLTGFTNVVSTTISATTYQNLPSFTTTNYVQLTANTTTTNLTYTDVPGMSITLSSTGVYQIEIFALTLKGNNAGLNLGITVPTTSTYAVNFMGSGNAATQVRTEDSVASGSLSTVIFNALNGLNGHVRINALITTTGTGDVKLGFASVTSGTATIRSGTYMLVTKIA